MSALSVSPPYPIFSDADGQPLEDGYVWLGLPNQDPQVNATAAYWDAALTQPAPRPIRTLDGYPSNSGTPARIYVNGDYSIRVTDKNGAVVYNAPAATDRFNEVVVSGINAVNVVYDPAGIGAVQTNVQAKLRETVSVQDFGAVGDGVTNDFAAIQAAVNAAEIVYFPKGAYYCGSAVTLSSDVVLSCYGATIKGAGWNSNTDIFDCDTAANIQINGGIFKECRYGLRVTTINSAVVKDATFTDCMIGILFDNVNCQGFLNVSNCSFSVCEIGIDLQSTTVATVEITSNRFESIAYRDASSRPYPLDKKIVSGLWYQDVLNPLNDSAVSVCDNFVDGVVGPTALQAVGGENEVHGLAVSLNATAKSSVIFDSNTIQNTAGHIGLVIGDEGLVARANSAVVTSNILLDAGCSEGMLYAKGTEYHKIANNIVRATPSNPKIALVRGLISTGSNCDVSNNKFIDMPIGMITRASVAKYSENEFVNVYVFCFTMRLESGTAHKRTIIENNFADENCLTFFINETADGSTATYGDFVFQGNEIFTQGSVVSIKAAENFVFDSNFVNRISPNSTRDIISFRTDKTVDVAIISNNNFVNFDDNAGTGRVVTMSEDSTTGLASAPHFIARNNYFGNGQYALVMSNRDYVDLVIFGNQFFTSAAPVLDSSITVSNYNVKTQNVGIDLV